MTPRMVRWIVGSIALIFVGVFYAQQSAATPTVLDGLRHSNPAAAAAFECPGHENDHIKVVEYLRPCYTDVLTATFAAGTLTNVSAAAKAELRPYLAGQFMLVVKVDMPLQVLGAVIGCQFDETGGESTIKYNAEVGGFATYIWDTSNCTLTVFATDVVKRDAGKYPPSNAAMSWRHLVDRGYASDMLSSPAA